MVNGHKMKYKINKEATKCILGDDDMVSKRRRTRPGWMTKQQCNSSQV
jgi:hypothetical protein